MTELTLEQIKEAIKIMSGKQKQHEKQPEWRIKTPLIVPEHVECPICKKYEDEKK